MATISTTGEAEVIVGNSDLRGSVVDIVGLTDGGKNGCVVRLEKTYDE